jgi:hypothetical protein
MCEAGRQISTLWKKIAGTPGIDIAAGRARLAGECLATATVAAALDSGGASAVPLLHDYVFYAGAWWVPASPGWGKVPRPGRDGESFPLSPPTFRNDFARSRQ